MKKDILFEIGLEEVPARFMRGILDNLKNVADKLFKENRIKFKSIETFGTSRRLVLYLKEADDIQEKAQTEIKGPPEKIAFDGKGQKTDAAIGFAKKQGIDPKNLIVKEIDGAKYVFALKEEESKPTIKVLPQLFIGIVNSLYMPLSMRWEDYDFQFIRPIHWLLALYGNEVVKLEIAGIKSDSYSRGHRFLSLSAKKEKGDPCSFTSGQKLKIKSPEEYEKILKKAKVIARDDTRKQSIRNELVKLAQKIKAKPILDEELLEEVTFLVEYPELVMGSFHNQYLELPQEVLITSMKKNQKYFSLVDKEGKFLEKYVVVTNGYLNDKAKKIIKDGCEKVLLARLEDAHFFYSEDKKCHLEKNIEKLKKVIYQEKLGSVYDKKERMKQMARWLVEKFGFNNRDKVLRTVELCKADLVSHMVGEFGELQGIMGKYYALYFKEDKEVAEGIYEHYLPRGAEDKLPKTCTGIISSLSDKIDNITGCISVNIIPSGSHDPYALRRQAQGIISIIMHWKLELSLTEFIEKMLGIFNLAPEVASEVAAGVVARDKPGRSELKNKILDFFIQRVKNQLLEKGNRYDVVESVLEVNYDNCLDAVTAVPALNEIYVESDFQGLVDMGVRVYRLSKDHKTMDIKEELFKERMEKDLYALAKEVEGNINKLQSKRDYKGVIKELRRLIKPVDDYFIKVLVMVEDEELRSNRLSFLKYLDGIYKRVADFEKIAV